VTADQNNFLHQYGSKDQADYVCAQMNQGIGIVKYKVVPA
jgi:hypothetical protein